MKNFLLFLFILIAFLSCQKEGSFNFKDSLSIKERSLLPSVLEKLNLASQPVNGHISVSSFTTLATQQSRSEAMTISGYLHDNNGVLSDFGTMAIDNSIELNADPNESFHYQSGLNSNISSLYGQNINISLEGNGDLPELNTNVYLPPVIEITSPEHQNTIDDMNFSEGTDIEWIADENNDNGVGILIEFNATSIDNSLRGINPELPNKAIKIHTEDDGTYTISSEDLSGIPEGALVRLHVARGDYDVKAFEDPDFEVGIYSYSIVAFSAIRN